MLKMLIGMMKMKAALKKLAKEDLVEYPQGHKKLVAALSNMGDEMGAQLELGLLMFLMM